MTNEKELFEILDDLQKGEIKISDAIRQIQKENANCGYPLLADVLAELDKKDLTGGGGVLLVFKRDNIKEVLSKYFS